MKWTANEPVVPRCAVIGSLVEARALLESKNLLEAWEAAWGALRVRPFHPAAYLTLAEIALAAGDATTARACAQRAQEFAPCWDAAKEFLHRSTTDHARTDSCVLPPADLQRIAKPRSVRRPRLSICLIVRNEEKFLGQCLSSVRGLADQIIVVDTGSTDRTISIAEENGAQVFHFRWCDDFSAARNEALTHATGDWILMLDADEELPPESHRTLQKLLDQDSVMAWRLPIVDVGREEEGCCYVPRLFRNAPSLFYVGCIHEQVFHGIEHQRQQWGLENRLGDAVIRHHGYRPEVIKDRDKIHRNLRLLVKAVEECPDEPGLLMNFGLELTRAGRREDGMQQYRKAFEMMSQQVGRGILVPETREMLLRQYCTQLTARRGFLEIIRVLTSSLARAGGLNASLHFTLGLAWLEVRNYSKAAEQMRKCLELREKSSLTPINKEIHRAGPNHCLAFCMERLGDNEAAAHHYRQAIHDEPGCRQPRIDFARLLAAQNEPVQALNLLFALVTEKPDDLEAWLRGGEIALSCPDFLEVAMDWTLEASRNLPNNPHVLRQRAEALTLAGLHSEALSLWRQLNPCSDAAVAAASVLCEAILGQNEFLPADDQEPATSAEFIKWYRKLLSCNSKEPLSKVNTRLELLSRILPTAADLLADALTEAGAMASSKSPKAV